MLYIVQSASFRRFRRVLRAGLAEENWMQTLPPQGSQLRSGAAAGSCELIRKWNEVCAGMKFKYSTRVFIQEKLCKKFKDGFR